MSSASPRVLLIIGVLLIGAALTATFALLGGGGQVSPVAAPLATPTPARLMGQLPAETVAVDVRFEPALGLPDVVRAGDHVDVLAFLSGQITGGSARTVAVLKDATVLRSARESSAQALTFAVPPAQALVLEQLNQLKAPIFLVLRPPDADGAAASDTFTDGDLDARIAAGNP